MKPYTIFSIIIIYALTFSDLSGQNRLPFREYVNPEETVVLDKSLPFQEAITLFEELSIEFREKIIIDRSEYDGPIAISIERMHWFDALKRIASYHNLIIDEQQRFIEIKPQPIIIPEEKKEREKKDIDIHFNTREVEIKATFFEGNRRKIRELGIDWTSLYNGRLNVTNLAAGRVTEEALRVELNVDDITGTNLEVNALLNALESSNVGEIISSPTIKVIEGETGRIQVGQDFSIRQRDFAGNVIDQFFSTGTILEVLPTILYHEGTPYIYMLVSAERSTAAPGAISTVVNKQEAETEVLLLSGETTIIAGLYETEENMVRRGVPFLKDLPGWVLGLRYLFGYNSTEYTVQELVIVLQATLVPTLEERLQSTFQTIPEMIDELRSDESRDYLKRK